MNPELNKEDGAYYVDCKVSPPSSLARCVLCTCVKLADLLYIHVLYINSFEHDNARVCPVPECYTTFRFLCNAQRWREAGTDLADIVQILTDLSISGHCRSFRSRWDLMLGERTAVGKAAQVPTWHTIGRLQDHEHISACSIPRVLQRSRQPKLQVTRFVGLRRADHGSGRC